MFAFFSENVFTLKLSKYPPYRDLIIVALDKSKVLAASKIIMFTIFAITMNTPSFTESIRRMETLRKKPEIRYAIYG